MEVCELPEDEFDKLYAEELELMNERNHEATLIDEFFKDNSQMVENSAEDKAIVPNVDASSHNESNSDVIRKRLFQDTNLEEEIIRLPKRKKTVLPPVGYEVVNTPFVDPDVALIERIISRRITSKPTSEPSSDCAERTNKSVRKINFHRKIPHGDFQSITTEVGGRIYLEMKSEVAFGESVEKRNTFDSKNLLSRPYRELRMEAERELLSMNSRSVLGNEDNTKRQNANYVVDKESGELWVNKYRPQSYLDLLSDESTNRAVLHWMKLWDKVVFGIAPKRRKTQVKNVKFNKPKFYNKFAPEVVEEYDETGRPQQKVVLLCGPPGLGKTTLAHIIARHAGYDVVEMNASDDRTLESFRNKLEASTVKFGSAKRPICLIVDEIDGAPAPSINYLVSLLQAKNTKADKSKKGKKDKIILSRPVICICNDLYATSLRPLRQIALIVQFPPTQSTKLAQRLHLISRTQKMKADLSVLLALCNKTQNDIRSCLSVLQFVHVKSGNLKLRDLEDVSVGQKDYQRSLFSVWNDIFSLPRPKREIRLNPHDQPLSENSMDVDSSSKNKMDKPRSFDATSLSSRFSNILKVVQSCGEYEKLTLGWFENYLLTKFKHTHLEPVTAALEWATFTDILQNETMHSQAWVLNSYVSLSFVTYHLLFASNSRHKLQYPNQFYEFQAKLARSRAVVDSMLNGMALQTRLSCPKIPLVLDVLPYLIRVIQPTLRPLNMQLFSEREKLELHQLVDNMISYNLTYVQDRAVDGSYIFTLEPNIEEVALLPDVPRGRMTSYGVKQLIAREIELEKIKRSENYFSNQSKAISDKEKVASDSKKEENSVKSSKFSEKSIDSSSLPNHLQTLQDSIKNNQLRNKFTKISPGFASSTTSTWKGVLSSDIWYNFKEGYSNAVRRNVKMKKFFE